MSLHAPCPTALREHIYTHSCACVQGMSGMGGGMTGDLEKAAKKEATKQHETRRRRRRQEKREAENANRAAEATARGEL